MMTLKRLSSLFFALMLMIPLGAPAETAGTVTAAEAVNKPVIIPEIGRASCRERGVGVV